KWICKYQFFRIAKQLQVDNALLFESGGGKIAKLMDILLNGKKTTIPAGSTLTSLVEQTAKNPLHVIAEMNGAITNKAHWGSIVIPENATIELVTFVGGG
ncbi:MAG: sulfur carrier protein ThiS, partial [Candidatus Omnitrophica bacterium]|nr:sulfur carrier protein ThiS [Candidatus Omnitrophota bacterium]